jgi:hypothetical protein
MDTLASLLAAAVPLAALATHPFIALALRPVAIAVMLTLLAATLLGIVLAALLRIALLAAAALTLVARIVCHGPSPFPTQFVGTGDQPILDTFLEPMSCRSQLIIRCCVISA